MVIWQARAGAGTIPTGLTGNPEEKKVRTGEAAGEQWWKRLLLAARVRKDSHGLIIREGFMEEAAAVWDLKDSWALDGQRGREGISGGRCAGA